MTGSSTQILIYIFEVTQMMIKLDMLSSPAGVMFLVLVLVMLARVVPMSRFFFSIWILHVGSHSHSHSLLKSQLVHRNVDPSNVLDLRFEHRLAGILFCDRRPETAAWSLCIHLLMHRFLCLLARIFCCLLSCSCHCAQTVVMLLWYQVRLLRNWRECCIYHHPLILAHRMPSTPQATAFGGFWNLALKPQQYHCQAL